MKATLILILLRHGQSEWNQKNLFTGWHDCGLTETGAEEAVQAGQLLASANLVPKIIHTSVLKRAVQTMDLAVEKLENSKNIPIKKSWRLNERHYGDLTGKDKRKAVKEFGEEQVHLWRRSYDIRPPDITPENPYAEGIQKDSRYADLGPNELPLGECLKDVTNRFLPYWEQTIGPDLIKHKTLLMVAHGNSLRALVKNLDQISDYDISELNIPTGIPLIYELNEKLKPIENKPIISRYIGDPEAVAQAAAQVKQQTAR